MQKSGIFMFSYYVQVLAFFRNILRRPFIYNSLYFIVRANLGVFFGKETKRNKDIKGNVGHIFHYNFFYPTMHEKVKKNWYVGPTFEVTMKK